MSPTAVSTSTVTAVHGVSAIVAETVARHTDEVFALMGNGNAYFVDALASQEGIRITALRHEAGTVASADAYYRVSRRIACATTTYGPGYTNALTPLGEAVCSRSPLVLVVGGEPTTGPRPWDVDQSALTEAMGALTLTVNAEDPAATTQEAFRLAQERRLPVVLEIPYDVATTPVAENSQPPSAPFLTAPLDPTPLVTEREMTAVAKLLRQAQRPLVLAGRGARDAAGDLARIADHVGALTTASAPARGTFAGREWDLGVCGGFASEPSSGLIKQADVVLAVGVGLNQFTTSFGHQFAPDACIIQIDIADGPTNPRVTEFVRADAGQAASALVTALEGEAPTGPRWGGVADHARTSRLNFARDTGTGVANDGLLDPRSAMSRLNEILPANRQVISDGGHFIGWSSYYLDLPAPDSLTMVGTQFQSIGLGLPSAPGAALARPEATHVVVTGDGGGIMGLPDLDTLVRTSQSAVVIVFNDGCYGAEIHQYGSQGLDTAVMEIQQADFAKLAEGFGAQGVVVHTMEDLESVSAWVEAGAKGTVVVDLRISRDIIAPYIEEIIELTLKK